MVIYQQSTGEMRAAEGCALPLGTLIGVGYAGSGDGKNNPAMQDVPDIGPLPQGVYTQKPPRDEIPGLGPYVIDLEPGPENEMYGRSLFREHGDSASHPGKASCGCIVLDHPERVVSYEDNPDHRLKVIA